MLEFQRLVIKIAGESGQGVNSIGEMVAKALKRSGFCTFGYREYPSLIQGGHAFHQIDIADIPIHSSAKQTDLLICLSRVSFHAYLPTLKNGGQVIHMLEQLELSNQEKKLISDQQIKIVYIPAQNIARQIGGKSIMANVVMIAALWQLIGLPIDPLESVLRAEFASKPKVIEPNIACLKKGYTYKLEGLNPVLIKFKPQNKHKNDGLLSGNHLIAQGAVSAGVRAYFAYPMTPSSSILSYMADIYHQTQMLVKQVDDEITVVQMAIGAMFMGTRALVATSGGGFDLMTESVSLAGMTETPFVCILAQRPGPSTGLPTWTSASDLNLAVYAGHGEFPRCVIALSDPQSAYLAIQNAFNIAEKYQIPVVVLTEKQIAESLFQIESLPQSPKIKRHLVSEDKFFSLVAADRYKHTKTGISPRWLPGQSDATFVANSDEHSADGTVTEDAQISLQMYTKRLNKQITLHNDLPEPVLIGPNTAILTLVGWGSVKNTVCDVMNLWNTKFPMKCINYLHYEYVYPVRTKKLTDLVKRKQPICLIENNAFGQLGALLTQETGCHFEDKLLKFDGRPFFIDEVGEFLEKKIK
ncbi:hypothetical protein A3F02_01875 [Candidatus Curtissbacteria bacterium RIFCSPHIGHO2_12_FULL_38_9b]|uniref:2-oxoacid:ferredoxin oxidoreductase subunit alpha n=2 Tax=Candidatus Curtissiibacteriota TaxID=1752717 RepID=A0A1F5GW91_9BACT|nr:MAG: hypothetical protein A3A48_03895 [Candidatus Curtissbacteria bacterium RIFCSPLOWO2_01_FULL_37_9]OGD96172.1 MAG: hypothetical protein A3F02_01875 [Candidatus Curtissbacteria bacterium RIFCSPHIGHO2_12_FULL_38_9b]